MENETGSDNEVVTIAALLNRFQEEAKEKFNTITARYQPLFNPIIQALEGQVEALRQIPIVIYVESATQRMYEQAMEFTKYFELEAQLRDILRQALRHTDQLTNQFIGDLKVNICLQF